MYCHDNYFAYLSSDKSVNLYHSSTFQEARKLYHNELVIMAQFSPNGERLASCGAKTIKIWDMSSGKMLQSYANPRGVRAMAITFSRDASEVILCCIDSNLWRRSLLEEEDWIHVEWQARHEKGKAHIRGTPQCVAFSPDGSQMAVFFRGMPPESWGTETGSFIGCADSTRRPTHCSGSTQFGYAARLCWNTVIEHVVGIYNDGTIFKWYPLDAERDEMEDSPPAAEIVCSPDGRLIISGQRDGSLKIFSFESFSLLYNLVCMAPPTALAVSSDGRRIYDLRRGFCNVWEPNALIRMAEQDEMASDASSAKFDASSVTVSLVSKSTAVMLEPITTVCSSKLTGTFAFGNDGGALAYVSADGKTTNTINCGVLGIKCMAISDDGLLMAVASMDKTVTVRQVTSDGVIAHTPYFSERSEYPVEELHLDPRGRSLTVICEEFVRTLSLPSGESVGYMPKPRELSCWTLHPTKADHFIAITPQHVTSYNTSDISRSAKWIFDTSYIESTNVSVDPVLPRQPSSPYPTSPGTTGVESYVSKVLITPDKSQILVRVTNPSKAGHLDHQYMLVMTACLSNLESSQESRTSVIDGQPLPAAILALMELPLGFVSDLVFGGPRRSSAPAVPSSEASMRSNPGAPVLDNQDTGAAILVFIDRNFWVWIWNLHDIEGSRSKRHFFLPRDWINMECLELAQVTTDGRLLCPRNGEVAVVHHGLTLEWIEGLHSASNM